MEKKADIHRDRNSSPGIFYGWWIVLAAFLNLFFSVGIIYYGFPVFYPAFVSSLGFTHAQVTQGFLLGFIVVGIPFGLLAGVLIDRIGARWVILSGVGFIGVPLLLMGLMVHFWQYEVLCLLEVVGYALAGADCQSSSDCPMVSSSAWTSNGLCVPGIGTWWRSFSVTGQLSYTNHRVASCSRSDRHTCTDSFISCGTVGYALGSC